MARRHVDEKLMVHSFNEEFKAIPGQKSAVTECPWNSKYHLVTQIYSYLCFSWLPSRRLGFKNMTRWKSDRYLSALRFICLFTINKYSCVSLSSKGTFRAAGTYEDIRTGLHHVLGLWELKVSWFRKDILFFSILPKNERKISAPVD